VSVNEPAAKGTTILTGLMGQGLGVGVWATATALTKKIDEMAALATAGSAELTEIHENDRFVILRFAAEQEPCVKLGTLISMTYVSFLNGTYLPVMGLRETRSASRLLTRRVENAKNLSARSAPSAARLGSAWRSSVLSLTLP